MFIYIYILGIGISSVATISTSGISSVSRRYRIGISTVATVSVSRRHLIGISLVSHGNLGGNCIDISLLSYKYLTHASVVAAVSVFH